MERCRMLVFSYLALIHSTYASHNPGCGVTQTSSPWIWRTSRLKAFKAVLLPPKKPSSPKCIIIKKEGMPIFLNQAQPLNSHTHIHSWHEKIMYFRVKYYKKSIMFHVSSKPSSPNSARARVLAGDYRMEWMVHYAVTSAQPLMCLMDFWIGLYSGDTCKHKVVPWLPQPLLLRIKISRFR